jgi:hypothetical protein
VEEYYYARYNNGSNKELSYTEHYYLQLLEAHTNLTIRNAYRDNCKLSFDEANKIYQTALAIYYYITNKLFIKYKLSFKDYINNYKKYLKKYDIKLCRQDNMTRYKNNHVKLLGSMIIEIQYKEDNITQLDMFGEV